MTGGFLNESAPAIQSVAAVAQSVFAIALIWVGVQQFRIYRQQREIMSDQLLTEHRAFVNLRSIRPEPKETDFGRGHTFWAFIPYWQNVGSKPTQRGLVYVFWDEFPHELDERSFSFGRGQEGKYAQPLPRHIGPKATVNGSRANIEMSTLMRAFNNPDTNHLYIWGAFDYNDGFPRTKRKRTEFAFKLLVRADPYEPTAQPFRFAHLSEHNGADQDTVRRPESYKAGLQKSRIGPIRGLSKRWASRKCSHKRRAPGSAGRPPTPRC